MQSNSSQASEILITGGTSGLGYQLVKLFIEKGYHVVTTGRRSTAFIGSEKDVSFYSVDFGDLEATATTFRKIAAIHRFGIIINNAGVLSLSKPATTRNGLEYTFQVNFLSHLLANEIILQTTPADGELLIASVTSPVYKLAGLGKEKRDDYNALRVYSESKLYLALMSEYLSELFKARKITCINYDPGVFGSGIYRSHSLIFSSLYRIASPFMRKPSKVAAGLVKIITAENLSCKVIYDIKGRVKPVPENDKAIRDAFWADCQEKINPFLENLPQ
jgi:NAD(P)-dependent dehydrogenase (short-subunit alcohol dehydrogenase family)